MKCRWRDKKGLLERKKSRNMEIEGEVVIESSRRNMKDESL